MHIKLLDKIIYHLRGFKDVTNFNLFYGSIYHWRGNKNAQNIEMSGATLRQVEVVGNIIHRVCVQSSCR
jgi:hypothetical protein